MEESGTFRNELRLGSTGVEVNLQLRLMVVKSRFARLWPKSCRSNPVCRAGCRNRHAGTWAGPGGLSLPVYPTGVRRCGSGLRRAGWTQETLPWAVVSMVPAPPRMIVSLWHPITCSLCPVSECGLGEAITEPVLAPALRQVTDRGGLFAAVPGWRTDLECDRDWGVADLAEHGHDLLAGDRAVASVPTQDGLVMHTSSVCLSVCLPLAARQ